MELHTKSMDQNYDLMEQLYLAEKKRADELEAELRRIWPHAEKWLTLQDMLAPEIYNP